ncbi:MAG: hypothetical protein CSA20_07675 [Deltaproteobacteria bacterium]|nr:MAG: hypothetical protein CSA20_07675 [Deltaproteobacteria bacterium]
MLTIPSKKIFLWLSAVLCSISFQDPEFGISLDCARRFYTVSEIKRYIDLLSLQPNSFLQLHLTDNENVAIESATLRQRAEDAELLDDGSYLNPHTGGRFLSKAQIAELLTYARTKRVRIVPEINMPAHAGGFLRLASLFLDKDIFQAIVADDIETGELDLSSSESRRFALQIYAEYADLFRDCRYFHIGCDELFLAAEEDIRTYLSDIIGFLQKKGFIVRMWNDLITRENIPHIPTGVEISYWSYDGDGKDRKERRLRRRKRASVPDLQKARFNVLLYNSYYLYYVPSPENNNEEDLQTMEEDLRERWSLRSWDGEHGKALINPSHIVGACLCVWNEHSTGVSKDRIYRQVERLYNTMKTKRFE